MFCKPFEAPQRSVKNKNFKSIFILIQLSEMHGAGRVKGDTEKSVCLESWRLESNLPAENAIRQYNLHSSIKKINETVKTSLIFHCRTVQPTDE